MEIEIGFDTIPLERLNEWEYSGFHEQSGIHEWKHKKTGIQIWFKPEYREIEIYKKSNNADFRIFKVKWIEIDENKINFDEKVPGEIATLMDFINDILEEGGIKKEIKVKPKKKSFDSTSKDAHRTTGPF